MSEQLARDLELLADLFKTGGWRELRVESDELSLLYSIDPTTGGLGLGARGVAPATAHSPNVAAHAPVVPVAVPQAEIVSSWHAVTAPNLGTFYRSPKPGSPPFVEIGDRVTPETEICLLEVMKLFTSVKAGVAGIVRRIDAADAELVEGGQQLFHIEPQ
jgi:acetyl-CoA carboxylase biotin carboxyl carrier protein